ncbi:beta-glucosidase family protein [Actinoplanes cyaneus]|nr:glycoside hydrolase family 3 protein [Actinoplanes cyaneus]
MSRPTAGPEDLRARVAKLSLAQKIRLLTGEDFWSLPAEPDIGLRRIVVSDGPVGVRGEMWDETDPSACLPSPTAVAAAWDEDLAHRLGRLLAAEARRKSVDVLLAPVVNLHRTPYGGRHFECFSEDPLLSGKLAAALIRGVQSGGVAATVKHFVGNDQETDRDRTDNRIDEQTLREVYLAPFETVVTEAEPWAVMAAYNGVNGHTMTESPLLKEVLKDEWGFSGVVMSDWMACRSVAPSARAALDISMPGPKSPWNAGLLAAVESGEVSEQDIDEKVYRILVLAARVGALDGATPPAPPEPAGAEAVAGLLREAAVAGSVLTRNNGLLPLDPSRLRKVAMIGPLAEHGRVLGGGSATVFPRYRVGPLDGLRAALEGTEIVHAPGVRAHTRVPAADGLPLLVRFFGADGAEVGREERTGGRFMWLGRFAEGLLEDAVNEVEVTTRWRAGTTGDHTIGFSGLGRYVLEVDGRVLLDDHVEEPPHMDPAVAAMLPPQRSATVPLTAGQEIGIRLWHKVGTGPTFGTAFELTLEPPVRSDDAEIARAVEVARSAEVVLLFVGTTPESEVEGVDRTSLALPGRQDELIARVTEANPDTVLVVNAGAPVLLPTASAAAAVLIVWFPGQEYGNALADMLLGVRSPGGRMPTSWPRSGDHVPSAHPTGGVLEYREGRSFGYRAADADPLFAFGAGLSYSTWSLELVRAGHTPQIRVTNTGARRDQQIVQAYLNGRLAGWAAVTLDPGASGSVEIPLPLRAFQEWVDGGWRVAAGPFSLRVGTSSADLGEPVEITPPSV